MRADRFSPSSPPSPPDREKRKRRRKSFSPFPPTIFFSVLELYARHPSITAPLFFPQAEGKRLKIVIAAFHACLLLSGRTLDRLARNPFFLRWKATVERTKRRGKPFSCQSPRIIIYSLARKRCSCIEMLLHKSVGEKGAFLFSPRRYLYRICCSPRPTQPEKSKA